MSKVGIDHWFSRGVSKESKNFSRYLIATERCGDLTVHVQGDILQQDKRAVFLTVHDLGCNHYSWDDYVNRPCMTEIKERSIFIHVDVPGHEENAERLAEGSFPSLQVLGEDLVTILDFLHVKYVICLGEGAGANVLARFALAHPTRTLGLILINLTGSSTSVLEVFKAKLVNWKGKDAVVRQSAEDYLLFHKFGHMANESTEEKERVIAEFTKRLGDSINKENVKMYVNAFLNRSDLPLKQYKVDILLIAGMKGSYASVVEKMHKELDKKTATLLKIEKAGDVLHDAPAKVAHAILLFCKGVGQLTSVALPGIDRQRAFSGCTFDSSDPKRRFGRGLSMEEYDKPNIRRFSLTSSASVDSGK
ncbi:unnamed protein product [Nesidiocoris tenuis]|uniref:AB hydrolase-1 domain-containing protein n=1 Tax=Nesidiocoris tenuis TaxID=355587 RepID=A0A6H5GHA9_9HEMI|nr:unnamed protein product [Nesidiocoris tenuis]